MERIDKLLVDKNAVSSRTQAKHLVQSGAVSVVIEGRKQKVLKVSEKFDSVVEISIDVGALPRFVSRAGDKLAHAFDHWLKNCAHADAHLFQRSLVIDIGQSKGGFTDYALQNGAEFVLGIEVGSDQLAEKLKADQRVETWEQMNAKTLDVDQVLKRWPKGFDIAMMDVSFISQTQILPVLTQVLKKQAYLFSLVKPQFEVGRDGVGKNGIVRDAALFPQVEQKIKNALTTLGFSVETYTESYPLGGDGNQEFFVIAKTSLT